MIIDIHTHLGDILYPNGGDLIDKMGVKKKIFYDIISHSEMMLHSGFPRAIEEWLYYKLYPLVTRASRARNATATLENMRRSMDEASVFASACMPIPPYLTFDDLKKARQKEPRVIPFTGIDYTREYDIAAALDEDVKNGAKGLKLHPIIQRAPLNSKKTFQAIEAFSVHQLPVLFHCGISSYYLDPEKQTKENATLGEIPYAKELVTSFPDVTFIAGHAGLFKYRDVIELLSSHKNVMVDTSVQSPAHVRELIKAFGPERVMYASDWPYGNRLPAIRIIKKACKGDTALEKRIFYENAAALIGL
jgi:uncharacterized protein